MSAARTPRLRLPLRNASGRRLLVANLVLASLSVALVVVAVRAATGDDDPRAWRPVPQNDPAPLRTTVRESSPVGRFEKATCRERPHSVDSPTRWFHPRESFYPPDAPAPTKADLDHLVTSDDAVVVKYRPDAPPAAQEALRAWATAGIGVVVAPSRADDPPPLEAVTASRRLTCDGVDLDQLTTFTDRHFTEPLGYEPHADRSE
ncbi:MAG: DUF3105 domain-containing protein [Solirubrobacteraceae bacterium]